MWGFRYGVRTLLKRPRYLFASTVTTAIGVGALCSAFSVVDASFIHPLPLPDSDRLVRVWASDFSTRTSRAALSSSEVAGVIAQCPGLESVASSADRDAILTGGPYPEALNGLEVSPDYLGILGAETAAGRLFLPEEFARGKSHVVIFSGEVWKREFGGQTSVVGQTIYLDSKPYAVVGIALTRFKPYGRSPDFWIPMELESEEPGNQGAEDKSVFAKVRQGVPLSRVRAELAGIKILRQPTDSIAGGRTIEAVPLREALYGDLRPKILAIVLGGALLFLISCINLGNLGLVRVSGRAREVAIQLALGASRYQIGRMLWAEHALVSLLGGGLGLALGVWGLRLSRAFAPADLAWPGALDATVLTVAVSTSLFISAFAGLIVTVASRRFGANWLSEGGAGALATTAYPRTRGIAILIMAEVALSTVLLVGLGLLGKSLIQMVHVDLGFDARNLLTFRVPLPETPHRTAVQRAEFYRQLVMRLSSLPTVEAAGASANAFFSGSSRTRIRFDRAGRLQDAETEANFRAVSGGFLRALGVPVLRGAVFSDDADFYSSPVVVINDSMARAVFPGEGAVGAHIFILGRWHEILGVVGDIRDLASLNRVPPTVYVPIAEAPSYSALVLVRSNSPVGTLIRAIRAEILSWETDQPIKSVATVEGLLAETTSLSRFRVLVIASFAGVGYLLAVIGVFGVTSYAVSRRTREVGIRMALGEDAKSIFCAFAGWGLRLTLTGLAIGLPLGFALIRFASSLLFGVRLWDGTVLVAVAGLVSVSGLIASFVPALRATKTDPAEVLRQE